MEKNLNELGEEILYSCRNELCINFPYLDTTLCALPLMDGVSNAKTLSIATDGQTLYYNGAFLADRYLRNRVTMNRAYFHLILHCMLRHLRKKRGKIAELWDLAADVAVESILDGLDKPCLNIGIVPAKQKFYGECQQEMKVLTAEGIYRHLLRRNLTEYEIASLQKYFLVDDHSLWNLESSEKQDKEWKERAEKVQTGMETILAGQAVGGESILEQVKTAVRDDVDYRAFLRRFAVPREVMDMDNDHFDYIFYTYGLRLYGNLPLIEPLETREQKRIEDFVIAVDTSLSTSGELVRLFLASTYAILRTTEIFTRKVNIRVIQCDNEVRADTVIHNLEELRDLMEHFQLVGGSATDFRPVFEYVDKLQRQGAFTSLRGLVYFTDGMGIYPKKRPPYETAFILLDEPPISVTMPPWIIRLVLTLPDLERVAKETKETSEDYWIDLENLPQL